MRIAVVDTYYEPFLSAHYAQRPKLARSPYAEQLAALMARCFGTSDAYSFHLRGLRHDAVELVVNCLELQRQWSLEHPRSRFSRVLGLLGQLRQPMRATFLRGIAAAQIEEFDPDVVYVQNVSFFDRASLDALRQRGRLVVGQIASATPGVQVLRGYDLITTSFPHFVPRFRALGVDSEYLSIGFDERVLDRLHEQGVDPGPGAQRSAAVSFVGGIDPRVHGGRVALLEQLAERLPLEVWGYGVDALPRLSLLRERYRGEAWGLDMYEVLARSSLTINRHIDVAEGFANNMRLFEATGAGALLLTESAPNLPALFSPGREVVAYEDADGLLEKIQHYLEHDDERAAIAKAGQHRTLTEHTYGRRMTELADMLEARRP